MTTHNAQSLSRPLAHSHQATQLLRLPDVMSRTGLGRSTIYRLIGLGQFPQLVKVTSRTTAWAEREIDAWINSKVASRDSVSALVA